MILLILGLALWFASHLFPIWMAPKRDELAARLGEGPYKGAYALTTVLSVVVIVLGYQAAPYVEIWSAPAFLGHLNHLLMLVAIGLFIAGSIPSPVRRKIRHPQLAGVKLWALGHLLVNGDVASLVLFGGMLGWAVLALIGTNRRDGPRTGFPAVSPAGWAVHVIAAIAVFWVVVWVHGNLAGVPPFPG